MQLADGKNENSFYQVPEIKEPIISEEAELKGFEVKDIYLYDIVTEPGQTIVFFAEN